jgi:MFS-type transporter involved in bile tolerance (Atg22 family)
MRLVPVPEVSEAQLDASRHTLVREAAWACLSWAMCGGVILLSFALVLGARPLDIGLLAAIPFVAQAAQLPAIAIVERLRRRQLISVGTISAARVGVLMFALLPWVADRGLALSLLVLLQILVSSLLSVGTCSLNSWLHQLIPHHELGAFFSRRLFWGTSMACAGTLLASAAIDRAAPDQRLPVYAGIFVVATLTGFMASRQLARASEPAMQDAGPAAPLLSRLCVPFRDSNFRRLLVFLGAWNLASNFAAPFVTVYLLQQLRYPLATVTSMWVTSQVANAITLYLWGRVSDRLSNKSILAVALPLYFVCTLGLVFTNLGESTGMQMALLYLLHVLMGAASGGIGLATGNLGLKLAPRGEATTYLASIGLVSAVAGGVAPLLAGALAQALQASELAVVVRWVAPGGAGEARVLSFAHWEFVFALSAMLGLYVLHALSRIREGDEISERLVIQELALEALRAVNQLSSIGGALGSVFAFERLSERRRFSRLGPRARVR